MLNSLKRLFSKAHGEKPAVLAAASIVIPNTQTSMSYVAPRAGYGVPAKPVTSQCPSVPGNGRVIPSPLNIFGFVLPSLEGRYPPLVESSGSNVNDLLMSQMQRFRDEYSTLDRGHQISYSTDLARFAYVYGYAPVRANAVYDALQQTPELQELFDLPAVKVACIGGGPGSDLLGISKYVAWREKAASKTKSAISAIVCDRVSEWKPWWDSFEVNLRNGPSALDIRAQYLSLDILNPGTWNGIERLAGCHLYTISYCMGEFRARQREAEIYFHRVIDNAGSGSWFVFIDNSYPADYGWFDRIRSTHGLSAVHSAVGLYKPGHTELDEAAAKYNMKYGDAHTNMTIKRAVRVCVKR